MLYAKSRLEKRQSRVNWGKKMSFSGKINTKYGVVICIYI